MEKFVDKIFTSFEFLMLENFLYDFLIRIKLNHFWAYVDLWVLDWKFITLIAKLFSLITIKEALKVGG